MTNPKPRPYVDLAFDFAHLAAEFDKLADRIPEFAIQRDRCLKGVEDMIPGCLEEAARTLPTLR